MSQQAVYTHGFHASVLRSHSWHDVQNSAAYLIPYLKPNMTIFDVGCGPGTITTDLAVNYVPDGHVTGLDAAAVLRLRAPRLWPALRFVQDDLASYPFYLYTQLAKSFPDVWRADLDRTVAGLLACYSREASSHCSNSA